MRKYTHQFHCLLEIVHHSSPWVVCFEARRCIYRPKGGLVGEHATGFVFSRGMAQFSYLLQQRLKPGFSEWSESQDIIEFLNKCKIEIIE